MFTPTPHTLALLHPSFFTHITQHTLTHLHTHRLVARLWDAFKAPKLTAGEVEARRDTSIEARQVVVDNFHSMAAAASLGDTPFNAGAITLNYSARLHTDVGDEGKTLIVFLKVRWRGEWQSGGVAGCWLL